MLETILRRIIIVGAFLTLLVPFVVVESSFFPFIVGKAVVFRILVGVMLGAWASLVFVNPAYRPRWSPVLLSAAIFLAVVALADAFGVNPARSFWSNFERMEGFVTIFYVISYLFVIGSVIRSQLSWSRFLNASVITSVVSSFVAFADAASVPSGQLIRVDATLGNPIYLAVYVLVNIFITCLLAYRARANRPLATTYAVAVVVQLVALYYTGTRGAFVGLFAGAGLAALVMLIRGREHPRSRRVAGAVIALAFVVVGGFFVARRTAFVQENPTLARVANMSLADDTVKSRITLWTSIGWDSFLERPLFGWGQDNFIVAFGKHYDPLMYGQEPWFDRAHNVFVDWLVAAGAVGAIAYLALFVTSLWMLWKSGLSLPEKAILTGFLGAYVCNNIFVFDNLVSYIYFVIFLAFVHARVSYGDQTPIISSKHSEIVGFVTAGFAILALALIWSTAVRPMARAMTLLDALRVDYRDHDPVGALALYDKSLAYGSITGLEETREQLSQTATRALAGSGAGQDASKMVMSRAVAELVDSATAEPGNTRRLYFLAHTLKEIGQLSDARTVLEQALAINPFRQDFLYELGDTYLSEGRFDMVIETMKRAYEAEKENDTAFGYYSGALMFAGRIAEGEALLMDRFGTTTVDNKYVLQAYVDADMSDKVAAILELRLQKLAPGDDPSARVSLAMAYLDMGRRDDAVAQLSRAAELRPDFARQADEMIAAIKAGKKIKIK